MRRRNEDSKNRILDYVNSFFDENHTIPSVREISDGTEIAVTTVHRYLCAMKESGELEYNGRRRIGTTRMNKEGSQTALPVLGSVTCGPGDYEEENVIEYIRLPERFVGKGEFFALIAKGESMTGIGVFPGDYVVVRKQNTAEIGDIIIALYDDGLNNKDIHFFVCGNNIVDYRGTCKSRHYVRADSVEQVVMLELRRMADFLRTDEDAFADLLAQKTNKELLKEQKQAEADLQKAVVRSNTVSKLYEKLYEDNAIGKVSDEWFMQLSHKYETERLELKTKMTDLRKKLFDMGSHQQERENFIHAIRRFMEMEKLTAPLLRELIDHIDVYETEGVGKNRTQRIVIYYRFVGYIELPDNFFRTNY